MAKAIFVVADSNEESGAHTGNLLSELGVKPVFAKRSAEVMAFIKAGASCIVMDHLADDMGGNEILDALEALKTPVPFIVMSQGGDRADVIKATGCGCVDWIEKPVEKPALEKAIKRAERQMRTSLLPDPRVAEPPPQSRDLIRTIARKIKDGNIDLPEVPRIIKELNHALMDLNVEVGEIQKIIEQDPSLTARLVSTVNTATYGGRNWSGNITDLPSTLTRLGNLAIRNLVNTEVIKNMFNFRSPAFKAIFDKMWRNHCLTAQMCREIATTMEMDEPEEMYLMGLLHNIGELFLLRVLGEFFQKQNNQLLSMPEVLDMVRQWHTVFGESLIKKWNLGDEFAFVARNHHDLDVYFQQDEEGAALRKKLHVVNLANQLTKHVGVGYYEKELPAPGIHDSYEAIGIPAESRDALRERVHALSGEIQ